MATFSWRLLAVLLPVVAAQTVTYELEKGVLNGVTVGTSVAGFSGTGYVEGFDAAEDSVTVTVTSDTTKLYDLEIVYNAPYGAKYTTVLLNGGSSSNIPFESTTEWTTVSAGQVLLNAGNNTISLVNNWGWYLVDAIKLTPAATRGPHAVTTSLVNTKSNAVTKKLMEFLVSKYGKAYLSGQQDLASVQWLEQNVGKTPAIIGLDFMDYSPSRVERGTVGTAVEEAIAFDARGGIVAFCWHWNAPTGLYDVEGKEWWRGFYTDSTDFNVETALADTTNANYTLIIRDIDAIATQLKRLQTAGVPVLWRPLHEAEGGWFWWGAKGAAPAKKLWNLVYDRLTNYHGLNNLIWTWNSVAEDWYPGDSTVDILSYDSYGVTGDHGPVSAAYNTLLNLGSDKKLIAATEVGSIPDPDQIQLYQADWLYFCVWGGDFISGGQWNSLDYLKKVYTHDYVLTLDEIQGWKGSTAPSSSSSSSTVPSSTSQPPSSTSPTATSTATGAVQTKWGQCGGTNYNGPTVCVSGTTCTPVSPPWYYQCL